MLHLSLPKSYMLSNEIEVEDGRAVFAAIAVPRTKSTSKLFFFFLMSWQYPKSAYKTEEVIINTNRLLKISSDD